MKYNLIFKEKRKKISFFTTLIYLLKLISFFDFADFQILHLLKIFFVSEKCRTNIFFISIFLENFFIFFKINEFKKIEKLKIPTLLQLSLFIKKCIFFIKNEFKLPILTLPIFFIIYYQRILKYIGLNKKNITYKVVKKNLNNSILFLKMYFSFFKELFKKDMKIYIYILIKISKNFEYTVFNLYKLRSNFFRYLLHYQFQFFLKERVIYIYS